MKTVFSLFIIILFGCNTSDNKELSKIDSNNQKTQIDTLEAKSIAMLPNQVQMGIESITQKDGKVEINIYGLSAEPIAGVQLEINPADIFSIDSIGGGRCAELDFTLRSNPKGLMLGFSMSGQMIPASNTEQLEDNILFTAYGKVARNVNDQLIALECTLAGKGGVKLDVLSHPYSWENK